MFVNNKYCKNCKRLEKSLHFRSHTFEAFFDVLQCGLLLILATVILVLTTIHFCQTRPPELTLSRPSSFEYYVLKGETSRNGNSRSTTTGTGTTGTTSDWTGTTGTGTTGMESTGTGVETRTETKSGISVIAM
ncbi:hypothetical protein L3Y34_018286 [Caenorhabditis briggsae]|uniref:Uncharacterized protein n=1 Tax=Caenorhabditis briggsae TaxID=6238 RepID=A0AAE9IUZ9_CAEBR|nr:hypothetical protein L3Y34_018286 [Caenorhabditis briggsae]